MQNGHARESSGCVELGFSKDSCSVQLSGGADVQRRGLSWLPLKVLLCDDLVGVVTSHVTKMAATPFDPPWPKPHCCTQTSRLSFLRPKLLPIKVFHYVYSEFRLFIAKMEENIKYFIRTSKLIKMIPKHIFWPIIDCFSMYVTRGRPKRIQDVVSRRSSPNR